MKLYFDPSLKNLLNILETVLPWIIGLAIFIYVTTSSSAFRYLHRNLAEASKEISRDFRDHGMEEVEVEGKVSLGLVSFKVVAKDSFNKKDKK